MTLLYVMLALGPVVVGVAGLLDLVTSRSARWRLHTWSLLASAHFNLHYRSGCCLPAQGLPRSTGRPDAGAPVLKLRGDYLAIVTLGFMKSYASDEQLRQGRSAVVG